MKTLGVIVMVLAAIFLLSGCVQLTDQYGNVVELRHSELGFSAASSGVVNAVTEETLHALVKGSIYETGEQVSVFGACLNAEDLPFNGTYATFSAWYPNGTQFIDNMTLPEIQTGYYLYTAPMSNVQGTYLTELVCHITGSDQVARAFGEWQNPYWVKRIELLNDSISALDFTGTNVTVDFTDILNAIENNTNEVIWQINNQTQDIEILINNQTLNFTVQLDTLQQNIDNSFNVTWNLISEEIYNLSQNITVQIDEQTTYIEALIGNQTLNLTLQLDDLWAKINASFTQVLTAIDNQTQNFTITIGNLQQNMSESFEITWNMIESVNTTVLNVNQSLYEQLIWVAGVANASVDRNDSLIMDWLRMIYNATTYRADLVWQEYPDDRVIYYKNWNIDVEVFNTQGVQLGWPVVACYINTTNIPPSEGELFESKRDNNNEPYFTHTEEIHVLTGFNWSTWCVYN